MRWLLALSIGLLALLGSPAEETKKGKRYVIAIAPTTYTDAAKFRPLTRTEADAGLLVKALIRDEKQDYGMVVGESNGAQNPVLKPTAENIRSLLKTLSELAQEEDEVILFFAGHGFENETGSVYCPSDASFSDPNRMIYVKELTDRLNAMAPQRKLLILDACREFRDNLEVKYVAPENPLGETTFQKQVDPKAMRVVIEACSSGGYAYEMPGTQSGIVTTVLLEALTGKADSSRDGEITIRELVDHLRSGVPRRAREARQVSQMLDIRDGSDGNWLIANCPKLETPAEEAKKPIQLSPEIANANLSAPAGPPIDARQPAFASNVIATMNQMGMRMSYDAATGRLNIGGNNFNISNLGAPQLNLPKINVPKVPVNVPQPRNLIPPEVRRLIPN
jgi:hypothetical protein